MLTVSGWTRVYDTNIQEDAMTERANFRTFYRDAHAVSELSQREKIFMGLAVALARNCQH